MTTTIDQTRPADGAKWAFDSNVTAVFDDMLQRSIPAHDEMRRLTFDLGQPFVVEGSDVIDLGCSRGAALVPFVERAVPHVRYLGLDESGPMLDAARERFEDEINTGVVAIEDHDLRVGLPDFAMPSLTLAILTLQFVPIEHRQRLVADVFRKTRPGGAMIVVEKCLGDDAAADDLLVSSYYRMKADHGYTAEQIASKRRSLEGVLVPLTAAGNEAMLRAEGWKVQRFWQHLQFAGWIAVKPKEARRG